MSKKPVDEALVPGLIRAQQNEGKFVDAAVQLYRAALEKNMPRLRAQALVSGQLTVGVDFQTKFIFRPKHERVSLVMSGRVSAEFSESSDSGIGAS